MLYECGCCKGVMEPDCVSRVTEFYPVICVGCERKFLEEQTALKGDEMYAAAYCRHVAAATATAVMSGIIAHC